ncbi:MAG: hypothetical protein WDA75_22780 [Candidatus Latescibacterota bacterium]
MILVRLVDWLAGRRPLVLRLAAGALAVLVLLDAVPGVVNKEHAHTWVEHLPGFWALFGLIGCVLLVVLSKWFGHRGIAKREDYYDD